MAEKVVIDLEVDVNASQRTLGQLEDRAEKLNKELRKVPLGSKAFNELKQELVGVNKEIKNTELAMESLGNEQVASELGSVAGAVGDVTAAFILLGGDEDSALGETAKRIETALGVTMAFKGTIEGVISFQKLWNNTLKQTSVVQGAIATGTKIYAAAQGVLNFVIGAGSKALKLFRLALISTGIGAIVVGIGMLIANFGKIKEVIMDVIKVAIEPFRKALQWIGLIESDEESARKERAKAERQRAEVRKKDIEQEIRLLERRLELDRKATDELIANTKRYIALQKEKGEDVTQMEEQLLDDKIKFAEKDFEKVKEIEQKKAQLIRDQIKEKEWLLKSDYAKNFEFARQGWEKELLELQKQLDATVTAEKDALEKVRQAKFEEEIADIKSANDKKKRDDKAREERKKERNKRLKAEEQARFDLLIAQKEADAEEIQNEREKAEALINIEILKHKRELQNKELTDAEIELLEFEHQQAIAEISQAAIDKELEQEQAKADALLEQQKLANEKKLEEDQKLKDAEDFLNQERIANEIALQDAKLNAAKGLIAGLQQVAGQNEKVANALFIADKALAIGEIIINTQREISSYLSNPTWSLLPDGGAAVKASYIAAAKIRAATSIATIVASSIAKFKGGGGGSIGGGAGGGSIAGAGATAPTIAPVTNTSTLVPQEPQQVYVTETDITNTQNQVAVIETQATIK